MDEDHVTDPLADPVEGAKEIISELVGACLRDSEATAREYHGRARWQSLLTLGVCPGFKERAAFNDRRSDPWSVPPTAERAISMATLSPVSTSASDRLATLNNSSSGRALPA